MTNHIFVLSYRGAQQFFENKKFQEFERSTFYFIDNGQQTYNNSLGCWSHTTERNIGCAGGWNLICKIAFDWFNLDKIIITQDDAPNDGNPYVRLNGEWVLLTEHLP